MPEVVNPPSRLDQISTSASILDNPTRFAMRYGRALRAYIGALVRDAHDADDVCQTLLLEVLNKGLARHTPGRGRFRDYLKAILRNVAADWFRRRQQRGRADLDLTGVAAPAEPSSLVEQQWLEDWRACVLEAAWTALELHQYQHPGNHCYSVLRLAVAHPDEDATRLAGRLATQIGQPMRPDAFRKQLSRARRLFAGLLVEEVKQTLSDPSPRLLEEELLEVGLLPFVQPYLTGREDG